jgi:LmbE family N-acetylglucosaminyl deacetylase
MEDPVADELGTILGVWAHPDDEAYLTAGLMARAARAESRVVCVTATRGEGGSLDEEKWPSATMGQVREQELLRSLAVLGVTEHLWLDLPDVDMDTSLPEEGAGKVTAIMGEVQPDTVLTFGPDGMTDHAGHKSISRWTTDAFGEVAKGGARLFYATTTPDWAERWVPVYNRFNVFRPGTPPVTPREELGLEYDLPPDILELKLRAIQEHVSQVGGMVQAFGEDIFREAMRGEYFRLAAVKA